jgi:hypothetical protein
MYISTAISFTQNYANRKVRRVSTSLGKGYNGLFFLSSVFCQKEEKNAKKSEKMTDWRKMSGRRGF